MSEWESINYTNAQSGFWDHFPQQLKAVYKQTPLQNRDREKVFHTKVSRGAFCFSEVMHCEYSGGSTLPTSTGKYSGGFWPSVSIFRATWYGGGGSYAGGVEYRWL